MILWLDAQLPDEQIFQAAHNAGAVVVTKDSDFLTLLERRGPPPQVIWLTIGNCANASLMKVFRDNWSVAADLLRGGEPLVEIGTTGADRQ